MNSPGGIDEYSVSGSVDLYDTTYGSFEADVREQVRRETYGEDIGQNSWLTADEYRHFLTWLEIGPDAHLLEVATGSGGPALFVAQLTGARVTGIDINERGVAAGHAMARDRQLDALVHFLHADASGPLPFEDRTFDAVV